MRGRKQPELANTRAFVAFETVTYPAIDSLGQFPGQVRRPMAYAREDGLIPERRT